MSAVLPRMNDFGKFEPRAGAYEVWAFDANAKDVVDPPEAQIRISEANSRISRRLILWIFCGWLLILETARKMR